MGKIKGIFCVLFGHSKIVGLFFGEVTCGRCGDKIGDTLAGIYDLSLCVIKNHNCPTCRDNYKKLGFRDKFLVKNPFSEAR